MKKWYIIKKINFKLVDTGAYMDSEDNYTFEREKDDPRKTGDNCGEKSLKRRKGI